MNSILNSFNLRNHLNPELWENYDETDFNQIKLKTEIRGAILKIAKSFIDSFELPNLEIEDIVLIGSLANFNWSEFSDIDIHILLDKSKLGEDSNVIDELFDAKKTIFNLIHDIKVKGFDVELYAQDVNDNLDTMGLYSVLYNTWDRKPVKEDFKLDKKAIIKKIKEFNNGFAKMSELPDNDEKLKKIDDYKEKIRKYRKSGLNSEGELSNENLVFKYLRRSGFMEKLSDLKIKTQDSILSLENVEL